MAEDWFITRAKILVFSAFDVLAVEVYWLLLTINIFVFKIIRDNFVNLELIVQVLQALLIKTRFMFLFYIVSVIIHWLVI